MHLLTKPALSLLGTVISLGSLALSFHGKNQAELPRPAATVASPAHHLPGAHTTVAAIAPEAGHVEDVYAGAGNHVAKGQVLVRLSIPFNSEAVRQERLAVGRAEAAYQQHPTASGQQHLRQLQAHLATATHIVRDSYVVAPVAGYLASSLVIPGQYVPRKGEVALIEVPVRKKME